MGAEVLMGAEVIVLIGAEVLILMPWQPERIIADANCL